MAKEAKAVQHKHVSQQDQEILRQELMRIRYLEAQIQEVQQQITISSNVSNEIAMTIETLNTLKGVGKDSASFAPIGSGVFVAGTVQKQDRVLFDVGSGVVIEKPVETAVGELEERRKNIVESIQKLTAIGEGLQKEYNELAGMLKQAIGE